MGLDAELRLAGLLSRRFLQRTGYDLTLDPAAFALVVQAAKTALPRLAAGKLASVTLPFIISGTAGPLHLDDVLSPDDLRALITGT
ncbi:MAG TPA: hypothetical protein DCM14_09645 [Clostridiales bacterium UBA8153]|nr:hypothetical protein [Clostridiales bacterium UBA8153]